MKLPVAIKTEPRTDMNSSEKDNNFSPQEDLHVDILECANPGDYRPEEEEAVSQDGTSCSSSFDDSICAPDDSGVGDEEAQSILCEDYPLTSVCDGTEFFCMRKKKLTDEWRQTIRPITWRCRWLELKVKEFLSQARKYEKEIANCYLTKQFELEKSKSEGYDAKSIPFSVQTQRVRVLKRRKRKRVEETTDVASYMSSHNIFSYAKNRKKKEPFGSPHYHDLDLCTVRKTTAKENEIEDDCLVPELKFSDDFVADVLRKIDEVWEKAQKLKGRVDELMCEPSIEMLNESDPADPEDDCCRQPQPVHVEDISTPHIVAPSPKEVAIQNAGQRLISISPRSFGGGRSIFSIFEDVEEDAEMNDNETASEEELNYFRKIINEITGVPRLSSEEPNPEDDPATNTISNRVKTRKRKRQPTWMSTTSARRRAAALRRKTQR